MSSRRISSNGRALAQYARGTGIDNAHSPVIKGQVIPFFQETMCGNIYDFLILTI